MLHLVLFLSRSCVLSFSNGNFYKEREDTNRQATNARRRFKIQHLCPAVVSGIETENSTSDSPWAGFFKENNVPAQEMNQM
jgi:hypothetical protein